MKVLCVGFGFVGKAYALLLRELGHTVYVQTGVDKTYDEAKDYGFLMHSNLTDDFDAVCIAVPTPTINGKQDTRILEDVLWKVKSCFHVKNIFIKSTVVPATLKEFEKKYKKHNQHFYMYPEFLEAQNPIGGVFNQKCCAFGKTGEWKKSEKRFISMLFGLSQERITFTTLETASILKYIHNMWLSCNVSFWNAIKRCTNLKDIDFDLVLAETHKSEYFGKHPWHIGTAYGGACLPKDIKAFLDSVEKDSVYKKFIKAIDEVNESVRRNE